MLYIANSRLAIPSIQSLNQFIKRGYNTSIRRTPETGAAVVSRGNSADSIVDASMSLNDRIIGFGTWYAQQSDKEAQSPKFPTPLMDLRSESAFSKRRLVFPQQGTTFKVVPFPIEFLKERSFELPGN